MGWLVLSRKVDQKITVEVDGKKLEILVVEIRDDKVRIGLNASQDFQIHREEVSEAIKRSGVQKRSQVN